MLLVLYPTFCIQAASVLLIPTVIANIDDKDLIIVCLSVFSFFYQNLCVFLREDRRSIYGEGNVFDRQVQITVGLLKVKDSVSFRAINKIIN